MTQAATPTSLLAFSFRHHDTSLPADAVIRAERSTLKLTSLTNQSWRESVQQYESRLVIFALTWNLSMLYVPRIDQGTTDTAYFQKLCS